MTDPLSPMSECPNCDRLQRERDEFHEDNEVLRLRVDRLRAALERLPITSPELIRLRNKGMITFDKQVTAIVDCLLEMREATRPAHETSAPWVCSKCGAPVTK